MKLLLTGKNGQVGFELQRVFAVLGEVVAIDSDDCDLADEAAIRRVLRDVYPDVIVNPAPSQFKIGHALAAYHLRPAPALLEGRCRPYPGPDSLTP